MQETFDFRVAVINSLDKLIGSGKIEEMIEAQLAQTIQGLIQHQLREYSDFGKELEVVVKKSLAINTKDLDLPAYNDTIIKIIRKQVENYTNDTIQKQIVENMKFLLEPPPETIKFSTLVEKYIEQVKDKQDAGCVCYGDGNKEIMCRVDREDRWGWISIDLSEESNDKTPDIHIGLSKEGKVYFIRYANQDIEKQMFVGPLYGFEKMLFQMKAAGSTVIMDTDPYNLDLTYGYNDD